MCDTEHNFVISEHNVVIGRHMYVRYRTRIAISFWFMCATAQNTLRQMRIVAITTLGAKTSVPCADIGGRNESAALRFLSASHDQEKFT